MRFTLYKMIFYLKFLSLVVKFGKNKNKIDNLKIMINLLTELNSYFTSDFSALQISLTLPGITFHKSTLTFILLFVLVPLAGRI